MRRRIAKVTAAVQLANPLWFVGVAFVAISVGLLSGVALRALPIVVAEIVGWVS